MPPSSDRPVTPPTLPVPGTRAHLYAHLTVYHAVWVSANASLDELRQAHTDLTEYPLQHTVPHAHQDEYAQSSVTPPHGFW